MSQPNPFAAPGPETVAAAREANPRLLWNSVGVTVVMGAIGAVVGVAAGGLTGSVAPWYYAGESASRGEAMLQGMAIGLGQGLGGGVAAGVALVALFYWYRSRMRRNDAVASGERRVVSSRS